MTQKDNNMMPLPSLSGVSGRIAAIGFGNPEKPKMLALHGWLDNAASFQPIADYLQDYYIVALDFPGHGLSARRPEGSVYHLTDYVSDVAHVVRSLQWQAFTLTGHSLGAGVSILYAALFPEQVSRLVMIDGLGPATANAESATARMRRSVDAGLFHTANASRPPKTYSDWAKLVSARMLASPLTDQSATLLLQRGTTEVAGGFAVNADPRLKHPSAMYMSEEVVLHFIQQIRCPSLLILAEEGMVASRSVTNARIAAFQQLRVETLPGKHHLHMDTPDIVAATIKGFLHDKDR